VGSVVAPKILRAVLWQWVGIADPAEFIERLPDRDAVRDTLCLRGTQDSKPSGEFNVANIISTRVDGGENIAFLFHM